MPYMCIKPDCDNMNCVGCNCAIPESDAVLLRLRRLHKLLASGRDVDGFKGAHALEGAIVEIERLRSSADWLMQCLQLVEMYGREALNKESQDESIDWREFAVAMFSNAVKWRSGPAWCITQKLVHGDKSL